MSQELMCIELIRVLCVDSGIIHTRNYLFSFLDVIIHNTQTTIHNTQYNIIYYILLYKHLNFSKNKIKKLKLSNCTTPIKHSGSIEQLQLNCLKYHIL